MAAKMILAFCASALLVQTAFSQYAAGLAGLWGLAGPARWNGLGGSGLAGHCLGVAGPSLGLVGPGLGLAGGYGAGCGCGGVTSTGGGLAVFSASPIAPIGISVVSENAYEGVLTAGGNVPFLSTISIEGVVPTYGTGAILYGCGNGAIGITAEEGPVATGVAPSVSIVGFAASDLAGLGCNGLGYNGVGYLYGYGAIL